MTSNKETVNVIAVVLSAALLILGIQSCIVSQKTLDFSDEDIINMGHSRLVESFKDPDKMIIMEEKVIRPGRYGGDFGYWARYEYRDNNSKWISKEHYDE